VKTRIIRVWAVAAALVAVASAAFLFSYSFLGSHDLAVQAFEEGLPKGEAILVKTRAGSFGVQKGDAFPYLVEVWYNPDQISEIDRASLDKGVNLEPFEIRDTKETEFDLNPGTRVYRREFELQLINGQVEHLYEFPTLVVRYSLKGSEGLSNKTAAPEPIYVAPRLPADVTNLDLGSGPGYGPLRPVKGEVEDVGDNRLPWILWGVGGFLAALGVADLGLRVIPQWKETAKQRRRILSDDVLAQAYRSLHENVAMAVEPMRLLHQMEHILRLILARKEKIDWLEEPNLDLVPSGIREPVISLFEKCQKSYAPEEIEQNEMEDALRQLAEILGFYFGEAEMAAWKS
jgi:hypothetical protein